MQERIIVNRHDMIERIGSKYLTANIEGGEYSYVVEAGSKAKLEKALGHKFNHFKLDIRFEDDDVVILVETKQPLQTWQNKRMKITADIMAKIIEAWKTKHNIEFIQCKKEDAGRIILDILKEV